MLGSLVKTNAKWEALHDKVLVDKTNKMKSLVNLVKQLCNEELLEYVNEKWSSCNDNQKKSFMQNLENS